MDADPSEPPRSAARRAVPRSVQRAGLRAMCRQGTHELGRRHPLPASDAFLAALERAPDSSFARSGFGAATAMFKYAPNRDVQWPEGPADQGHVSVCDFQSRSPPSLRYRPPRPPPPPPPPPQTPPAPRPVRRWKRRKKGKDELEVDLRRRATIFTGRFEHKPLVMLEQEEGESDVDSEAEREEVEARMEAQRVAGRRRSEARAEMLRREAEELARRGL